MVDRKVRVVYGSEGYGLAVAPHPDRDGSITLRPMGWNGGFSVSRAATVGLIKALQDTLAETSETALPAPQVHEVDALYRVAYLMFRRTPEGKPKPYLGHMIFPCNSVAEALHLYEAFARFSNDSFLRTGVFFCPASEEMVRLIAISEKTEINLAS